MKSILFVILLASFSAQALVLENADNDYTVIVKMEDSKESPALIKISQKGKSNSPVFWARKQEESYADVWYENGGPHSLRQSHSGGSWTLAIGGGERTKTFALKAVKDAAEPPQADLQAEYEKAQFFFSGTREEALKMNDMKAKLASDCDMKSVDIKTSQMTPADRALPGRAYLQALVELCQDKDYKSAIAKYSKIEFVPGTTNEVKMDTAKPTLRFYLSEKIYSPKNLVKRKLEDSL